MFTWLRCCQLTASADLGGDLQLIDLSASSLSGAIARIPTDDRDFDPDWEIDPKDIKLMDKLGAPALAAAFCSFKHLLLAGAALSIDMIDPGEGEFGVVHKAMWHGTAVAAKIIKDSSAIALGDFRSELEVLRKVGKLPS